MTPEEATEKVLRARHPRDVFNRAALREDFLAYAKLLHPDVGGQEATFQKLAALRDTGLRLLKSNAWDCESFTKSSFTDDAGPVYRRGQVLYYVGPANAQSRVRSFSHAVETSKKEADQHFLKYLPKIGPSTSIEVEGSLREAMPVTYPVGSVRVGSTLFQQAFPNGLEPHHVAWILSRMFEFSWWICSLERAHIGFTPYTVFVVPETHGLVVGPMYHLTPFNQRSPTGTAAFKHWYPGRLLKGDPTSGPDIDVCMAKRLACYLQGDPTGNGTSLLKRKELPKAWVEYLVRPAIRSPKQALDEHKKVLKAVFGPPKFHKLELPAR